MKLYVFFFLCIILYNESIFAQDSSCVTNKIILNTGINPITGAILADGEEDPSWKITNLNNTYPPSGVEIPYNAFAVSSIYWGTFLSSFTNSKPINSNVSSLELGGWDSGPAIHTVKRNFYVSENDSFHFYLHHKADDYIASLVLDDEIIFESPIYDTISDFSRYLTAGCHQLSFTWGNANIGWGAGNPGGFILEGYVESINGDSSLLSESCNPALSGNDSISYCGNCASISPNLVISAPASCDLLGEAKVYFTSGYTNGEDTLQFVSFGGINGSFNSSTGVLSLSGFAPYSVWQEALRTVCYKSLVPENSYNAKNIVISLGSGLYNPDNGHFYRLINNGSSINWSDARNAASGSNYYGLQGYLVTITSEVENNFLTSLINSNSWIGASDSAVEGVWRWVTGCEGLEDGGQGRHFSNQQGTCGAILGSGLNVGGYYQNWATSEPNDADCNEDFAHLIFNGSIYDSKWNDYHNSASPFSPVNNYIIEYGCMPEDSVILNLVANVVVNIHPPKDTFISKSICLGSSFEGYINSGIYLDTFSSSIGCDSVRTISLSVIDPTITSSSINVCSGDTVTLSIGLSGTELCDFESLPPNFQNGLIAYYPFCGSPIDASGNGHNGVAFGATLTTNRFGAENSAFSFSPSSYSSITTDYVHTADSNNFTFSVWVEPQKIQEIPSVDGADLYPSAVSESIILGQAVIHPVHGQSFGNVLADAGVGLYVGVNGLVVVEHSDEYVRAGLVKEVDLTGWHMITIVYNDKQPKLYIDGEFVKNGLAGTRNVFMSIANDITTYADYSNSGFGAGFYAGGTDSSGIFKGKIDDIFFWNRTLSSEEIEQLYTVANNKNILWSTGDTTTSIIVHPTTTTDYTVQITVGAINCLDSFEVIINNINTPISQTICEGEDYLGYNTAGLYTDTFVSSIGCDSIRTLTLSVNPTSDTTIFATICEPDNFLGYTSSGIYTQIFPNSNGCDSTRIIHLTVYPITDTIINANICQGNSLMGYDVSGTYIDTFTNANGCDSVRTLNLIVNPITYSSIIQTICQGGSYLGYNSTGIYFDTLINSNGCDSIRTLNLTVHPHTYSNINSIICYGESYLGYVTTGIYYDTFTNANGCDSIRILSLTVNPINDTLITKTICEPESFLGLSLSGTYTDVFTNIYGCDSTRTIILTVNPIVYTNLNSIICEGENYLGYNATGIYFDTFTNVNGCDSIRTINLTVNPVNYVYVEHTICQGESYLGYTATGYYVDTLTNIYGCDSVRTLSLLVNPTSDTSLYATICEPNEYLGYTSSGTYVDVFTNIFGCDSTRTLNLIVNPIVYSSFSPVICQGSSYEGYTITGTYIDTFTNANGCDSIRTINLTVNPITYGVVNPAICMGESYLGYTTAGTYIDTLNNMYGCDSVRTINLSVNPVFTKNIDTTICHGESVNGYSVTGLFVDTLMTVLGCDSIINLNLSVIPAATVFNHDSIACYQIVHNGITYLSDTSVSDTLFNYLGCDSIIHNYQFTILPIVQHQSWDTAACDSALVNGIMYHQNSFLTDTIRNVLDCDSIYINRVISIHHFKIDLVADPESITIGQYVRLDANVIQGDSYTITSWSPYTLFGNSTSMRQTIKPTQDELIIVNAEDVNGCISSDSVMIKVNPVIDLLMPNVFSPNGDGLNDVFGPVFETMDGIFIESFSIYNRFGECLFNGYGKSQHWDGTFNNKPCEQGVYFYHLQVSYGDGRRIMYKGDFTLVR